jgi:hypothetical protein
MQGLRTASFVVPGFLLTAMLVACSSDADGKNTPSSPSLPGTAPPVDGPTVTLTVSVEGTSAVRSEPAGIECPGTCTANFAAGAHVKLVPVPAEGWRLDKWSGACAGTAGCEVVLDAPSEVKGTYALIDPRWDPSGGAADCVTWWGNAGDKLSPCDKTPDDYVVATKSKRNLAFCNGGKLVKNMRIGLGFAPTGDKVKQGDGKTPEGVFYIPTLLPDSEYHRAFLLSYPSKDDAVRGANEGIISRDEADKIISQQTACEEPDQDSELGGAVEIHGMGSSKDWTFGCLATDNEDVDTLWGALEKNDTIIVVP